MRTHGSQTNFSSETPLFCLRREQVDALTSGVSAFVLLNGPSVPKCLLNFLSSGNQRQPIVVADGAANLISESCPSLIPSHIVGDFDSVDADILAHYRSLGCKVVNEPCQDSNDFSKAMHLAVTERASATEPILVLGGQPGSGRLDQFFGNIQELSVRAEMGIDVWWLSEHHATMVLGPGKHRIFVDPSQEGPKCGLVPIAGVVSNVTTHGLRWDLTSQSSRFGAGGLVSSSNEVVAAAVDVETSGLLLWTCDVSLRAC